jgi:hypothetical protein
MNRLNRLLDTDRVEKLASYAITDVPELVGALEADEASVGKLLGMNSASVKTLHNNALKALDASERAILEDVMHGGAYGAWNPNESQANGA